MQAFETQLSDTEIAAIVTYERNAWGNDKGDLVQPVDILKAKGGNVPTAEEAAAAAASVDTVEAADEAPKELSKDELMKKGEAVYQSKCAVCHKPDGSGMPPTFPSLKDSEICKTDAKTHIDRVLKGVKGTAMQAFAEQLDETEIAAVVTYERNAWNGGTGSVVQPKDISDAE